MVSITVRTVIEKLYQCDWKVVRLRSMIEVANEMPSAELERRKGHWIDSDNYYQRWKCSECGCHTRDAEPNYCPHCGAEMSREHQEPNPALTWDELRTMEGKPVWIDSVPLVRRWVIIKKFHPIGGNKNLFDMEVEDGAHFLRKNMRRDDPAWWQAYRKERS